jgi:alpha-galactosidase
VDEAIRFYRAISPIIQNGVSKRYGPKAASYRHPAGWQAVERTAAHGGDKLIVIHVFDRTETEIRIPLEGPYQIVRRLTDPQCKMEIVNGMLSVSLADGACAFFLRLQ